MNPFNGSFSFLIDQLPANTPFRVNIYAQNSHLKRSPMAVEFDARTLRAAERRIDSQRNNINDDETDDDNGDDDAASIGGLGTSLVHMVVGHARGRKSSFFEELYGGYGRFRSKHLVVGLMIGAVAVAVFVAILLIIIVRIKNKNNNQNQQNNNNNLILSQQQQQQQQQQLSQVNRFNFSISFFNYNYN